MSALSLRSARRQPIRTLRRQPGSRINKAGITVLTGDGVSVHVVENVPKTEDPRGGRRRAASEQRGAEFVSRLAGVEVRAGLQRRAHAARQRVHLVRSAAAAAALQLASIALHAHCLARALQRRQRQEADEEGKGDGEREGWRKLLGF